MNRCIKRDIPDDLRRFPYTVYRAKRIDMKKIQLAGGFFYSVSFMAWMACEIWRDLFNLLIWCKMQFVIVKVRHGSKPTRVQVPTIEVRSRTPTVLPEPTFMVSTQRRTQRKPTSGLPSRGARRGWSTKLVCSVAGKRGGQSGQVWHQQSSGICCMRVEFRTGSAQSARVAHLIRSPKIKIFGVGADETTWDESPWKDDLLNQGGKYRR